MYAPEASNSKLGEERRCHVSPALAHTLRIISASKNLIAPIVRAAFIWLASEHIEVLQSDEVFSEHWLTIRPHRGHSLAHSLKSAF